MAENLTPKKYIDSSNMKQILTAVKNEIHSDDSIITTESQYLALPEEQKLNNSYYLYDIGVHYKNGVAYSRKEPISLTMAEYKALGEVDPDQEYIVSADEQGILLGAEDIGYSNAVSNLPCTTVQGAIDKVVKKVDSEIKNSITEINSKLEKKTQNISGTIDAKSILTLSFTEITNEYPFYSINIDNCSDFSQLYIMNSTMKDGYLKVVLRNDLNGSISVSVTSIGIKL